jgi:hypothetical protein
MSPVVFLTLLSVWWQKKFGFGRMDNGSDMHYRMSYWRPYRICRLQFWDGHNGISNIGLDYLPRPEI